mmetsp:Transcript_53689/g.148900  ORF Transcript_53689/g.148900 Transcript_53689/m.148900 type:complete len:208 (+) Transcript_53689:1349-1972(+)
MASRSSSVDTLRPVSAARSRPSEPTDGDCGASGVASVGAGSPQGACAVARDLACSMSSSLMKQRSSASSAFALDKVKLHSWYSWHSSRSRSIRSEDRATSASRDCCKPSSCATRFSDFCDSTASLAASSPRTPSCCRANASRRDAASRAALSSVAIVFSFSAAAASRAFSFSAAANARASESARTRESSSEFRSRNWSLSVRGRIWA